MAKKLKMNPPTKGNKDFNDFCKQLPQDQQDMLKAFGINSFTDLMGLSAMLGLDVEKIIKHDLAHPEQSIKDLPPVEDFMMDEDHPMYDSVIQNLDEFYEEDGDDPFMLPEQAFTDGKAVEYHIRIKLNKAPLPIWRELKVPSNITLEALSFILIEVMGWKNIHLHQFKKGNTIYKSTVCINQDFELMPFSRIKVKDTNDYSIAELLEFKGDRIIFEYDFGDSWEHDVWLKGIREYNPDETPTAVVIKGKGACPPEDCGGVWGYSDLIRIHSQKRKSKEDKEQLEWYYMLHDFNPEDFDVEDTQLLIDDLWDELRWEAHSEE